MTNKSISPDDIFDLATGYQNARNLSEAEKILAKLFVEKLRADSGVLFTKESSQPVGLPDDIEIPELRDYTLHLFDQSKGDILIQSQYRNLSWLFINLGEKVFLALNNPAPVFGDTEVKICKIAKQIEDFLQSMMNEEKYLIFNKLIRSLSEGVLVAKEDGTSYFINESAADRIGIPVQDGAPLYGLKVVDFEENFKSDQEWTNHVKSLKKSGSWVGKGWYKNKATGKVLPMEISSTYVQVNGSGFVIAVARDISKRVHLEEELQKQNDRFLLALEGSNDGIWDWDLETNETFFSGRWKKMLGYKEDELDNNFETFSKLLHPEDQKKTLDHLQRYLRSEESEYQIDFRMQHKDGSYKWILSRGHARRDEKGNPYRMAGSHTDITNRKQIEADLMKTKELLEEAGKMAMIGPWEVDLKTGIGYVHAIALEILEVEEGFSASLPDSFALFYEEDQKIIEKAFSRAVNEGVEYDLVLRRKLNNGGYKWIRTLGKPDLSKEKPDRVFGVIQDIDDSMRNSLELERAKKQLESVFNEMEDVVWSVALPEKKLIFITPSIERLTGQTYRQEKLKSDWWKGIINQEDIQIAQRIEKELSETGYSSQTMPIIAAGGETKWVLCKMKVVLDESGAPIRCDAIISDRTEPKILQDKLQREIDLQNIIIKNLSTYLNSKLADVEKYILKSLEELGEFVEADRVYVFDYNLENDTAINTHEWCREGIRPEIHNLQNVPLNFIPAWVKTHKKGKSFAIHDVDNYSGPDAPGVKNLLQPQNIKSILTVPMMSGDKPLGFIGFDSVGEKHHYSETEKRLLLLFSQMLVHIENRKQWELELSRQEEKYRNLIDDMNIGLINLDVQQQISFVNETFCKMSGYKERDLVGHFISDIDLFGESYQTLKSKEELRRRGVSDTYKLKIRRKDGEKRWWLINASPSYNDREQMVGTVGAMLDITDEVEMKSKLEKSKLKAEQAAQAREVFLANMSHEIRTPLSVVIGMIRQLSQEKLTSQQAFFVKQTASAARHLLAILNNILDMTKIEAGELTFEPTHFSLENMLKALKNIFKSPAEEKGLPFKLNLDPDIAKAFYADDTRIRQVLFNLLSNSLKFTEKGSIQLSVEVLDSSDKEQKLCILVEDTGVGMSEEFIRKIFDKFAQEEYSTTRRYEGTGLGMAISRDLIEQMGGDITVESVKGKGTKMCLTLTLPFGDPKKIIVDHQELKPDKFKKCKVMIVEDNKMNRLIAKQSLKAFGCNIIEAENGKKALEILKTTTPDLILMDIQMPEMDGVQTTRHIRKKLKLDLPIIALTANAFRHDIDKYLNAGMNDFVIKPYDEADLLRKVNFYLNNRKQISETAMEDKDNNLYDLTSIREMSGGDEGFIAQMAQVFIKVAGDCLDNMEDALRNNDIPRLNKIAHKLKSSVDQLKIEQIRKDIRVLEKFPESGRSKQELLNLTAKIRKVINAVVHQLSKEFDL
ncbi:MAG: PAS domain S-box protein [Saprospirales bacterium]|nr:MAG: PAS domain S-box protein [Saprospirales bacterium]